MSRKRHLDDVLADAVHMVPVIQREKLWYGHAWLRLGNDAEWPTLC